MCSEAQSPIAAAVRYETVSGQVARLAEAIRQGLTMAGVSVSVGPVRPGEDLDGFDLAVLGAPTRPWGLSTCQSLREDCAGSDRDAPVLGMRQWLNALPRLPPLVAVFDVRPDQAGFHASAARSIAATTCAHGARLLAAARDFSVVDGGFPDPRQVDAARHWGQALGATLCSSRGADPSSTRGRSLARR